MLSIEEIVSMALITNFQMNRVDSCLFKRWYKSVYDWKMVDRDGLILAQGHTAAVERRTGKS